MYVLFQVWPSNATNATPTSRIHVVIGSTTRHTTWSTAVIQLKCAEKLSKRVSWLVG